MRPKHGEPRLLSPSLTSGQPLQPEGRSAAGVKHKREARAAIITRNNKNKCFKVSRFKFFPKRGSSREAGCIEENMDEWFCAA